MNRIEQTPERSAPRFARVRAAAPACCAVLVLVGLLGGCTEVDPLQRLAEARYRHEVRLVTWVEAVPEPTVDSAPEAESGSETPDDAVAEVDAVDPVDPVDPIDPIESAGVREAILSLFVASEHSPLELPCLTVDVVFTGSDGEDAELARTTHELDISSLGDAGRSMDVMLRVPVPDGDVAGIYVQVHDVEPEALATLCEGEAIAGGSGAD